MPESVEMPAPVRATMRSAPSTHERACSMRWSTSPWSRLDRCDGMTGTAWKGTSPSSPLPLRRLPITALSLPFSDSLTIRPWPDDVIDSLGFYDRSHYVETYQLVVLVTRI